MSEQIASPEFQVPPPTQSSNLAIISLIAGILGWFILPVLGAIIAIFTGHRARKEIRESAGKLTGEGMATAGLVLGYLNLFLIVIPICVIFILALLGPAIGDVFSNIVVNI